MLAGKYRDEYCKREGTVDPMIKYTKFHIGMVCL